MPESVFIYALCEPGTRTIRYIGKAEDPSRRFQSHLRYSVKHKTHLGDWLRSLKSPPTLLLLKQVSVQEWQEEEIVCIEFARALGLDLVNNTDGGDGNHNPSFDTKERNRVAHLGEKNARFGKKHTEETLEKMRAAKRGKKRSPETCARISASQVGRKMSSEAIKNRTASRRKNHVLS